MKFSLKLDHAAIATKDPEKLKRIFLLLGLADEGHEDVPTQGVRTHFIAAGPSGPQVEILQPLDSSSTVARYLDKKGAGIHHLSFEVEHQALDALCGWLRQNEVRLVYQTPQPGAHRMRVNFIHPESTGGILIEIAEKAAK